MMEMTAAKIGRLMKKLEIFMKHPGLFPRFRLTQLHCLSHEYRLCGSIARWAGLAGHGNLPGCDSGSGAHALQAADDDGVALVQAVTDHTQSLRKRTEFHGAVLERVIFSEHKHVFLIQIRDDSLVSCQAAALRPASLQTNPCEETGSQSQVLVRKSGPQANRSCRGTDLIVHKAQPAGVGKPIFIGQG